MPLSSGFLALVNGQIISILLAGIGIFATVLSSTSPSSNFPYMQMGITYTLLSTFLLHRLSKVPRCNTNTTEKAGERIISRPIKPSADISSGSNSNSNSGGYNKNVEEEADVTECCIVGRTVDGQPHFWWYLLAALFDLLGNSLTFAAYNFTTITSIMMLDCFTIPCVMVLSFLFLNSRYDWKQIIGITICLVGLAVILVDDLVYLSNSSVANNALLGDVLVLLSSFFLACSNVLEERLVKNDEPEYYLGHLGIFGVPLAAVFMLLFDLPNIRQASYTATVLWSYVGFVSCQFLMYVSVAFMLTSSSALVFNLSLLTSDVYSVIFSYFFHGYMVSWLYFIGFGSVLVGLTIYHWEGANEKTAAYSSIPTEDDSDDSYFVKRRPI